MLLTVRNPDGQEARAPFAVDGATSPHAYFDAIRARPECLRSWALRDQDEIQSITAKASEPQIAFTYNPANDAYHTPQDACRFRIPPGYGFNHGSGARQLYMGIPAHQGNLLFGWDWWFGPEFQTEPSIPSLWRAWKTWQVMKGVDKGWWTVYNTFNFGGKTPENRYVSQLGNALRAQGGWPAGLRRHDLVDPAGAGAAGYKEYRAVHSQWTRNIIEIRYYQPPAAFSEWNEETGQTLQPNPDDPEGRWHMLSHWVIDHRGQKRIMFRFPNKPNSGYAVWPADTRRFRVEVNTSQAGVVVGEVVAYTRNYWALGGYALPALVPESDTLIFQRPS